MNVFACDESPIIAAGCLADRHVVKMTLETAQILSTAWRIRYSADYPGVADGLGLYKSTHQKHPVVLAAVADQDYFDWLVEHGYALADEYQRRFGKVHASLRVIWQFTRERSTGSLVNAPYCGPVEHQTDSIVESYRRYLRAKYQQWGSDARWTNASPPAWLKE